MAILEQKFIHFNTINAFNKCELAKSPLNEFTDTSKTCIKWESIVYIGESRTIWTHGGKYAGYYPIYIDNFKKGYNTILSKYSYNEIIDVINNNQKILFLTSRGLKVFSVGIAPVSVNGGDYSDGCYVYCVYNGRIWHVRLGDQETAYLEEKVFKDSILDIPYYVIDIGINTWFDVAANDSLEMFNYLWQASMGSYTGIAHYDFESISTQIGCGIDTSNIGDRHILFYDSVNNQIITMHLRQRQENNNTIGEIMYTIEPCAGFLSQDDKNKLDSINNNDSTLMNATGYGDLYENIHKLDHAISRIMSHYEHLTTSVTYGVTTNITFESHLPNAIGEFILANRDKQIILPVELTVYEATNNKLTGNAVVTKIVMTNETSGYAYFTYPFGDYIDEIKIKFSTEYESGNTGSETNYLYLIPANNRKLVNFVLGNSTYFDEGDYCNAAYNAISPNSLLYVSYDNSHTSLDRISGFAYVCDYRKTSSSMYLTLHCPDLGKYWYISFNKSGGSINNVFRGTAFGIGASTKRELIGKFMFTVDAGVAGSYQTQNWVGVSSVDIRYLSNSMVIGSEFKIGSDLFINRDPRDVEVLIESIDTGSSIPLNGTAAITCTNVQNTVATLIPRTNEAQTIESSNTIFIVNVYGYVPVLN